MSESDNINTSCGTPEYIAPELLESKGYTKTIDGWIFDVLLDEIMTSLPPFYDQNTNTMYQRILHDPLRMPSEARSIMTSLLMGDPLRRLGNRKAEEIKAHPFLARHIDWENP